MEKETIINRITIKALLLDTISYLKFKQHLHPNYKAAKYAFCDAKGIKRSTPAFTLLKHIGAVYEDNGIKDDFFKTCEKMGYPLNEG